MKCPYCNQDNTRVVDSRPVDDNNAIRRRRMFAMSAEGVLPPMKR